MEKLFLSNNPTIKAFEQWVRATSSDTGTVPGAMSQTCNPVGVSSQQNAQVELEENVAWLLKNITFPPEFYPENGICRPHLKKIQPIPFLRIKGNDRQMIAFNPNLQMFEQIGIKQVAERVERLSAYSISIQNRKASVKDLSTSAEKAIFAIADKYPQAVYCELMAGYEGGVYQDSVGELFVVPKTIPITPAASVSPEDIQRAANPSLDFLLCFDKWKPLWDEIFCPALLWKGGGDDIWIQQTQIRILFKWLAGVRAVLMGKAELKIPMICFVGDAGSGKSLISAKIIKESLALAKRDPTWFLYGKTRFNTSIMELPVWLIDDKEIREKDCNARIKEIIVGDGIQIEAKGEKATPFIYPYIAIVLCANNDRYSRKMIPIIGNDNQEKIILLKTYSGVPNHSSKEWVDLIEKARPSFLAFLDYQIWPQLQAEIPLRETKTGRLIVPGWQNPEITGDVFEETKDGALHETLQEFLRCCPEKSGQEYTAEDWLFMLQYDRHIYGEFRQSGCDTVASFGRAIQRLIDNQFCPRCYSKRRDHRRGRLIKMVLNDNTSIP